MKISEMKVANEVSFFQGMAVGVPRYGGMQRDRHGVLNVGDVAISFKKLETVKSETNLKI